MLIRWLTIAGALAAASCAHTPPPLTKPVKLNPYIPKLALPAAISDTNFKAERDRYDALPAVAPARPRFRELLLSHLLRKIDEALARKQESEALKHFADAAALFHPTEAYEGKVRHPALARAAARLVAYYAPRGDEENVVLPLCVQITLVGESTKLREKYREFASWVDEAQQLTHGRGARGAQLIRVLEKTVKVWPSRFVLDELKRLYIERRLTLARAFGAVEPNRNLRDALPTLIQGAYLQTGYRLVRMYLRVDQAYQALAQLRELHGDAPPESELRHLLEQAVSPAASVKDQIRLAEHFEDRDRGVALRICQHASERFPADASGFECVGRIASALERVHLAVLYLERAVQLAPDQLPYAEALARQYQRRLFELIGDEQLEEARRQLGAIEAFYRRAEQRFKTALKPGLSRVYYATGHGFFNAGKIESAAAAFEKSVAAEVSPDALVQLAVIRLKREDAAGAERYLARAERSPMASAPERVFWQGRIEGLRGRAFELAGKKNESRTAHRRALEAWREWQRLGMRPEARAEAYVHAAHSLYAIGERSKALDALDQAIDVQPERKETYADAIAFLYTRGHLPEALDALHRALGRAEVTEYLKTYCSFWLVGLARRAKVEPDNLALEHLRNVTRSDAWYGRLAKAVLGETSFASLERDAKTVGNRAELYYYWADQLSAGGQTREARALWQKVIATDMMAFYEFDMSAFNLRDGAAAVSTRPLDRRESP
jgi:tetratricopeptide (TPR) repeat protein